MLDWTADTYPHLIRWIPDMGKMPSKEGVASHAEVGQNPRRTEPTWRRNEGIEKARQ